MKKHKRGKGEHFHLRSQEKTLQARGPGRKSGRKKMREGKTFSGTLLRKMATKALNKSAPKRKRFSAGVPKSRRTCKGDRVAADDDAHRSAENAPRKKDEEWESSHARRGPPKGEAGVHPGTKSVSSGEVKKKA